MAFSNGTFSRLYSWVTDRDAGVKIRADKMDTEMDGMASALSTCVLKDGTQTITANLPMNTKKLTELAAGSSSGDSLRYEQVIGKQALWIPAGSMIPQVTNGPEAATEELATNDVMVETLGFDASTAEYAQFSIGMPSSWDEGTVTAKFYWTHPATATNFGVSWELAAVAFANDDALDTAFGTAQEIDDTGGTTNDLYISAETPAITVAGAPGAGELVAFRVKRDPADAGDTLAVDAKLIGVVLFITTDTAVDAA